MWKKLLIIAFCLSSSGAGHALAESRELALEAVRSVCSGGSGTSADGERAKIVYGDKSLSIESDNRFTIKDSTGEFTRELKIDYDQYTNCLRDLITILGLDRPSFVTIDEYYDRWPGKDYQIVEGLRGIITSASSKKEGPYVYVNATLVIENVSNITQKISMIGTEPVLTDNVGSYFDFWKASGITMCETFDHRYVNQCKTLSGAKYSIPSEEYTTVPIGGFITIPMIFYRQTSTPAGNAITVAANFVRLDDEIETAIGKPRVVSFGIPNVALAN